LTLSQSTLLIFLLKKRVQEHRLPKQVPYKTEEYDIILGNPFIRHHGVLMSLD